MPAVLGAVGGDARPHLDDSGRVRHGPVTLDWWIGAGDRWHVPAEEPATRQRRLGPAPAYETVVRVPGGEAIQRVCTVGGPGDLTVVDVENASPEPFVAAFVVRSGASRRDRRLTAGADHVVRLDGEPVLVLPRAPGRWSRADGSTRAEVMEGRARTGAPEAIAGRQVEGAFCYPVPHRTVVRVALPGGHLGARPDLAALPGATDVVRGWEVLLDRGLRVELPDPYQREVDAARADLLLAAPSPGVAAALEDWGFDREFLGVWARLGWRARRRARHRARAGAPLGTARAGPGTDPAAYLGVVHAVLLRDDGDAVAVLPEFPPDWLGASLAVHGAPLRAGTLSFAVRWHGARPALLWDAPAGVTLRAPALDPSWSAPGGAGETLLGEPPALLLSMGARGRSGRSLDDPGSFT